jgi:hypothetical protein
MRQLLFYLVIVSITSPSFADDDPAYFDDYVPGACKPSCYAPEDSVRIDLDHPKRVCGYKDWGFQQTQIGGRWTTLASRGVPAGDPTVSSCKLPGDAGAVAGAARAAFAPYKDDLKDLHFVVQGGWHLERDDHLDPVRFITVRVFASNWGLVNDQCGGHGEVSCEATGSKTALAINYIHYRLDEAKKLAPSDKASCRAASFFAVATARGLRRFRDHRIATKKWATGVSYKTRYDGVVDEKTLFAKAAQYEAEALALHKQCGGASPLVTEVKEVNKHRASEFEVLPNPATDD